MGCALIAVYRITDAAPSGNHPFPAAKNDSRYFVSQEFLEFLGRTVAMQNDENLLMTTPDSEAVLHVVRYHVFAVIARQIRL